MADYHAPAQLPPALTALNNWLVWRLVQKPGEKKPRKVPFYIDGGTRTGTQGTPEDKARLSTYDRTVAACIKGHYTGIGFALMPGDNMVALDFDNCVVDGVIEPRIAALVAGTYAEFSPSNNGIRAFMKGAMRSRKDNADAKDRNADGSRKDGQFDIEFFGTNGFVTITGNATPDCELFGLEGTVLGLTSEVLALYAARFGNTGTLVVQPIDGADDLSLLPPPNLGWTLEQARSYLFDCDANTNRATWLNALMAIHHELQGSPEAFDLVDEWSATAASYGGREDVEGRWRSFGRSASGTITGKWLLKWRGDLQVHLKYDAVAEWKTKIADTQDEFTLREKVCTDIRADFRLDDMGRESLSQMLRTAFDRLGTKYQIAQCRSLIAEKRSAKQKLDSGTPEWLKGWTYVTDDDQFYRKDSDEWLTLQGFNASYNCEMPVNENGEISKVAAWYVLDNGLVERVTRGMYLPWADPLFTHSGIKCVNTYRPSSVPIAVDSLTTGGKAAVATVLRHLGLLCGNRAAMVNTFVDWMAHNVQQPGVKIRWAPLIKGVEGDGKSIFGDLMASVMGRVNVRNVSPKVLGTDFTGWAEGSALVVLEEIKLTGHNRHDNMNALKPVITNDHVEVHRKGKDGYDAVNTTNYIAFTNFVDALPLTDTDRRWFIIFTPFAAIEQMAAAIGPGVPRDVLSAYFANLVAMIQQYPAELRRWLLDHKISADFKPNSSAPMTDEKAVMIGMGVSEEESAVRELLEKGGVGISTSVFASSYVMGELLTTGSDVSLATSAWSRLLVRIGYTRAPKKLKWRGKTENVWVLGHKHMEPGDLRKALDATVLDDLFSDVQAAKGSEIDPIF